MINVFKKLLGYPLLGMGGLFLLGMVAAPLAQEPTPEQAETVFAGLVVGLPLSAAGGSLVVSASDYERQLVQSQKALEVEQARLRHILYELIEAGEGRVTLVKFAITADISATEARSYIDGQSKAFSAQFDVSESGSVVYRFPVS